jgi:hypothetical protein
LGGDDHLAGSFAGEDNRIIRLSHEASNRRAKRGWAGRLGPNRMAG